MGIMVHSLLIIGNAGFVSSNVTEPWEGGGGCVGGVAEPTRAARSGDGER